MKLTTQLLRSRTVTNALQSVEYLDLSNATICSGGLDKLKLCPRLKILNLSDNAIDYVDSLDMCPQLWKLDLANNQVKNLEGLRRTVALGSLNLANNDLVWSDLSKIQHMHILNLNLHGNRKLEKNTYYRIHVIDCLPNVWMLDGRIVTSAEREQAKQFFQDSELTNHPVRHKLSKEPFVPSSHKNIQVNGVFGERTDHFMRRFPIQAPLNVDMDKKRLLYLAYNFQQDFILEGKATNRNLLNSPDNFLECLLDARCEDYIRANTLLLLLVASLEFAVPSHLMQDTLHVTRMDKIGGLDCMSLFLLPKEARCLVTSILLSAVKVEKDVGMEISLYDTLYLSLYHSVAELTKFSHLTRKTENTNPPSQLYIEAKTLIATEVVQLLSLVPIFFDYCIRDNGVKHLVATATDDPSILDIFENILTRSENEKRNIHQTHAELSTILTSALPNSSAQLTQNNNSSKASTVDILMTSKAIPRRPQSSPLYAAKYLAKGRASPTRKPCRIKSGKSERITCDPQARLGDKVLLGPQNVARIISIPEADIVLVQMDAVPVDSGGMVTQSKNPEEHYTYIDTRLLYWDQLSCFWRPRGTIGDRITIHSAENNNYKDLIKLTNVGSQASLTTPTPQTSPRMTPTAVTGIISTPANLLMEIDRDKEADALSRPLSSQVGMLFDCKPELINEEEKPMFSTLKEEVGDMEGNTTVKRQVSENCVKCQDEEEENGTNPKQNVERTTVHDQWSVEHKEEAVPRMSLSRRSSLESEEELELMHLTASRPATATKKTVRTNSAKKECFHQMYYNKAARQSKMPPRSGAVTAADPPIEIPQVPLDFTNSEVSNDITDKSSSPTFSKSMSLKQQLALRRKNDEKRKLFSKSGPRPMSAVETYRMIVSKNGQYLSPYQKLRTEEWQKGISKSISNESQTTGRESPPPQRPTSPTSKTGAQSHTVRLQKGNTWLAGGRDVFWESSKTRPSTTRQPGWKEGLPQRPHSAAAFRALRRAKTPTIRTPSSMSYDMAVRGEPSLKVTTLSRPATASPLMQSQRALGLVRNSDPKTRPNSPVSTIDSSEMFR